MSVAAIYDIHGNLPALEAVLDDIRRADVDRIVVGGDVVAGPLPAETLALLQEFELPTHFIRGNAESELLRHAAGEDPAGLSERANEEARWVAKILRPEQIAFISGWATTAVLAIGEWGDVLFCHATPQSDIDVFTRHTPFEKAAPHFKGLAVSLVVCGHTHMQFDRLIAGVRVVNAGSVGLPFGHTGADWLLIGETIEFKHTDFNLTEAAHRIRRSAYPHRDEFAAQNVQSAPTEAEALAMLSRLEADQEGKR